MVAAPVPEVRPFCSKRCADVDLHRWLVGAYRVETNEAPEEEAADPKKPGSAETPEE